MNKLLTLVLIIELIFCMDPWGGISVSTSDNIDAISINPAGLGIDRGEQSAIYVPIEKNETFSIHSASRKDGFGYTLHYLEDDDVFNPTNGIVGYGTKLTNNLFMGLSWNKKQFFKIGTLYRPYNFLSFGDNLIFSEKLDFIYSYRAGLSIRPFLKHRLTIGSDINFINDGNDKFDEKFMPFLSLEPLDGLKISVSTVLNDDNSFSNNTNINIGLNFGKGGVFYNTEGENIGLGFTTSSQKATSLLNFKNKNNKNYVRMKFSGKFIEEKPKDMGIFSFLSGKPGIQLRTWVDQINELTVDENIDGLIIDLGRNVSAGFAKRNTIRRTLQNFKNAGKKIIVYSEYGISNGTYFIISMADEIYIPEMTSVDLNGLSANVSFYRGLLDTLSIVPEVFRVNYNGKSYKTAADPILNKAMSDEMRENYSELFEDLFSIFVDGISEGRSWEKQKTLDVINDGPYLITRDALKAGLISGIMYPSEFENYVNSLNNEKNTILKFDDLVETDQYTNEWKSEKKEKIAVIYAVGGIQSGKSNPGPQGSSIMGDKTIMEAIKAAREDDDIKALVLRIDSGGGSALASDHMWSEIIKTTKTDTSNLKPFIASMSDVAASGGYYIACEADTILADEATITGSIGVIGLRLNFSQLQKRFGVNQETLKFGENSDFLSSSRLMTEQEYDVMQASINDTYDLFKKRVQSGRKNISASDNLDEVAMGRVFTGKRALDLDLALIDKLGDLNDAIEVAKNSANIKGEVEIVEYPRKKKSDKGFSFEVNTYIEKKITDALPEPLKSDWQYIRSMEGFKNENSLMILPYKIEFE